MLQKGVPIQIAHIEEKYVLVLFTQPIPQAVQIVHLIAPLTHRKVLDDIHESMDFFVCIQKSEIIRIKKKC